MSVPLARSHKIDRVVESTIAGETRALSEALAEVEWMRCLLFEVIEPSFRLRHWENTRQDSETYCVVHENTLGYHTVAFVDARSLFEHLSKTRWTPPECLVKGVCLACVAKQY